MSMRFWTVTGYGVNIEVIDTVDINDKLVFIKKYLPDVYDTLRCNVLFQYGRWLLDGTNTSEYIDYCNQWIADYENAYAAKGFGAIFADAMDINEPNFNVECCSGDEGGAVMYVACFPWEMTVREKQMTREDMEDVFMKYLNDFGISENVCDRQSIKFYG